MNGDMILQKYMKLEFVKKKILKIGLSYQCHQDMKLKLNMLKIIIII